MGFYCVELSRPNKINLNPRRLSEHILIKMSGSSRQDLWGPAVYDADGF